MNFVNLKRQAERCAFLQWPMAPSPPAGDEIKWLRRSDQRMKCVQALTSVPGKGNECILLGGAAPQLVRQSISRTKAMHCQTKRGRGRNARATSPMYSTI